MGQNQWKRLWNYESTSVKVLGPAIKSLRSFASLSSGFPPIYWCTNTRRSRNHRGRGGLLDIFGWTFWKDGSAGIWELLAPTRFKIQDSANKNGNMSYLADHIVIDAIPAILAVLRRKQFKTTLHSQPVIWAFSIPIILFWDQLLLAIQINQAELSEVPQMSTSITIPETSIGVIHTCIIWPRTDLPLESE